MERLLTIIVIVGCLAVEYTVTVKSLVTPDIIKKAIKAEVSK